MSRLNYEKGLKKLGANIHQDLKLAKDALVLLSDLCNDLNSKLVEGSKSDFKTRKRAKDGGEMTHQNAQNAVKKLLKFRVRDFAIAEGQKSVFMYMNNLLRYNEKKALASEPRTIGRAVRPIRPRPPGSEYSPGLTELLVDIHPTVSLSAKGKSFLGSLMDFICRTLITRVAETARGTSTLRPEDISLTIGGLFGRTMYDHAHSGAMHAVGLYDKGFYIFTPKSRKPVDVQAPPMKRRLSELQSAASTLPKKTNRAVFTTGIKALATTMQNNWQLDKSAVTKLSDILIAVLQKLSLSAINNSIQNNIMELNLIALQNAVNEILPESLAFYAQAEGQRTIMLYHHRLVQFTPKHIAIKGDETPDASKRAAKRFKKEPQTAEAFPEEQPKMKKATVPDFTSASRKLLGEIHELSSFNRSAGELINKALIDLTKRMAEACVVKAKGCKELNALHVQWAVKDLFPGKVQEHAISEGNKAVALFAGEGKAGLSSVVKAPGAAATDYTAYLASPPATATPPATKSPVSFAVSPATFLPPATQSTAPLASAPATFLPPATQSTAPLASPPATTPPTATQSTIPFQVPPANTQPPTIQPTAPLPSPPATSPPAIQDTAPLPSPAATTPPVTESTVPLATPPADTTPATPPEEMPMEQSLPSLAPSPESQSPANENPEARLDSD